MYTNDDGVLSTTRLNFGQKVTETQPVHTPDDEVPIAAQEEDETFFEEQEEAMMAEAEAELVEETENTIPEDAEQIDIDPEIEIEAQDAISDPDTKSVEELQAEREKLDAEIKAKLDAQKASVIAQIKTVVETYSIPVDELVEALGGLKSKRKGIKTKQKFRDPASGATWSGRGKEPAWIKGQNRDDFLIPEDEQE